MGFKVIGGPADGRYVDIDRRDFTFRTVPQPGIQVLTTYTRRILREIVDGQMNEIVYFAPDEVSDLNVLRKFLT